jgi:hypothetical protein
VSAHCNACGTDLVHGTGEDWQVMTCQVCEQRALNQRLRDALDFIVSDATITPEGCPEPWRSTLIEWVQAADHALQYEAKS